MVEILLVVGVIWFVLWLVLKSIKLVFDESSALRNNGRSDPNATPGTITYVIDQDFDGRFYTHAKVDGVTLKLVVDTGATSVALTLSDAKRLGFDPEELDFCVRVETAGGEIKAAEVLINSIRIGQVEVFNVRALVKGINSGESLLGMTFLSKLHSYEIQGHELVIRQ